jgi:hypothetical protein
VNWIETEVLRYVAVDDADGSYLIIEEWESDMIGYGGGTETQYNFKKTKHLNKATLLESKYDYPKSYYEYGGKRTASLKRVIVKTRIELQS